MKLPICSLSAPRRISTCSKMVRALAEQPESDDADGDEVDRDDVVEEPRHHEDEDAGEKRDDGLQVADADGHGSLRVRSGNGEAWRVFPSPEWRPLRKEFGAAS